eukprot:Lankesteria_metandrocarpae@DN7272_c0_g1_i1.p1
MSTQIVGLMEDGAHRTDSNTIVSFQSSVCGTNSSSTSDTKSNTAPIILGSAFGMVAVLGGAGYGLSKYYATPTATAPIMEFDMASGITEEEDFMNVIPSGDEFV